MKKITLCNVSLLLLLLSSTYVRSKLKEKEKNVWSYDEWTASLPISHTEQSPIAVPFYQPYKKVSIDTTQLYQSLLHNALQKKEIPLVSHVSLDGRGQASNLLQNSNKLGVNMNTRVSTGQISRTPASSSYLSASTSKVRYSNRQGTRPLPMAHQNIQNTGTIIRVFWPDRMNGAVTEKMLTSERGQLPKHNQQPETLPFSKQHQHSLVKLRGPFVKQQSLTHEISPPRIAVLKGTQFRVFPKSKSFSLVSASSSAQHQMKSTNKDVSMPRTNASSRHNPRLTPKTILRPVNIVRSISKTNGRYENSPMPIPRTSFRPGISPRTLLKANGRFESNPKSIPTSNATPWSNAIPLAGGKVRFGSNPRSLPITGAKFKTNPKITAITNAKPNIIPSTMLKINARSGCNPSLTPRTMTKSRSDTGFGNNARTVIRQKEIERTESFLPSILSDQHLSDEVFPLNVDVVPDGKGGLRFEVLQTNAHNRIPYRTLNGSIHQPQYHVTSISKKINTSEIPRSVRAPIKLQSKKSGFLHLSKQSNINQAQRRQMVNSPSLLNFTPIKNKVDGKQKEVRSKATSLVSFGPFWKKWNVTSDKLKERDVEKSTLYMIKPVDVDRMPRERSKQTAMHLHLFPVSPAFQRSTYSNHPPPINLPSLQPPYLSTPSSIPLESALNMFGMEEPIDVDVIPDGRGGMKIDETSHNSIPVPAKKKTSQAISTEIRKLPHNYALGNKGFTDVGCYADSWIRAVPVLEGNHPLLMDSDYKSRKGALEKCARAALYKHFKIFAIQNGGQCFAGVDAEKRYAMYGKSTKCKDDGLGGNWANEVYMFHEEHGKLPEKNIAGSLKDRLVGPEDIDSDINEYEDFTRGLNDNNEGDSDGNKQTSKHEANTLPFEGVLGTIIDRTLKTKDEKEGISNPKLTNIQDDYTKDKNISSLKPKSSHTKKGNELKDSHFFKIYDKNQHSYAKGPKKNETKQQSNLQRGISRNSSVHGILEKEGKWHSGNSDGHEKERLRKIMTKEINNDGNITGENRSSSQEETVQGEDLTLKKIKDLIKEEKEEKVVKDDKIIININPGNNEKQPSATFENKHTLIENELIKPTFADDYPPIDGKDETNKNLEEIRKENMINTKHLGNSSDSYVAIGEGKANNTPQKLYSLKGYSTDHLKDNIENEINLSEKMLGPSKENVTNSEKDHMLHHITEHHIDTSKSRDRSSTIIENVSTSSGEEQRKNKHDILDKDQSSKIYSTSAASNDKDRTIKEEEQLGSPQKDAVLINNDYSFKLIDQETKKDLRKQLFNNNHDQYHRKVDQPIYNTDLQIAKQENSVTSENEDILETVHHFLNNGIEPGSISSEGDKGKAKAVKNVEEEGIDLKIDENKGNNGMERQQEKDQDRVSDHVKVENVGNTKLIFITKPSKKEKRLDSLSKTVGKAAVKKWNSLIDSLVNSSPEPATNVDERDSDMLGNSSTSSKEKITKKKNDYPEERVSQDIWAPCICPERICSSRLNLAFLIDASPLSEEKGEDKMAEIMEFCRRVSSAFTFSPVESRLGLITFATDAQIMVNFNRFRGPEALIEFRNAVKVKPHTKKYAGQALTLAKEGLFDHGHRSNALDVVIFITDGPTSDDITAPARALRDMGVTIISVGITSQADERELNEISSDPDDEHVFFAEYNSLSKTIHRAQKAACVGGTLRSPINPCSCNDPELSDAGVSAFLAGLTVNDGDLDKLDNPLARRYDILQPYDRYLDPKGIWQKFKV